MTPKDITSQQIDQAIIAYDSDKSRELAREESQHMCRQFLESPKAMDVITATVIYYRRMGYTHAEMISASIACGVQIALWIAANAPQAIAETTELSKLLSDDEFEQLRKEIANVKSNNDR